MNAEEELYKLLRDYDILGKNISEVLGKPHALDTIRLAVRKFYEVEHRYPHVIHSVLDSYLDNARRQEMIGQITHGSD